MKKIFTTAIALFLLTETALCPGGLTAERLVFVVGPGSQNGGADEQMAEDMEHRLQQTINLEYKDADLSNVLRSMAWAYKLNIVTSSDIKGKVSINLQDITVGQAL